MFYLIPFNSVLFSYPFYFIIDSKTPMGLEIILIDLIVSNEKPTSSILLHIFE
jgi:hypothetical protein